MEIKDITVEQTIAEDGDYLILQNPTSGIAYKIKKSNFLAGLSSNGNGSSNASTGAIISTGLVLHLDAANTDSYSGAGVVWTDLIGRNNASLIGSVSYNNGGYMSFSGGYINLYSSSSPYTNDFSFGTGDFSLEIWAKVLAGGNQAILSSNLYTNGILLREGSIPYHDDVYINGANYVNWIYGNYGTNQWAQLVLSRVSDLCTFYVNGRATGNATNAGNLTSGANVRLGIANHDNSEILNGDISIFRMYKGHGLSQAEITQNFNADKSRYGL